MKNTLSGVGYELFKASLQARLNALSNLKADESFQDDHGKGLLKGAIRELETALKELEHYSKETE
jgi:hypothetical protein